MALHVESDKPSVDWNCTPPLSWPQAVLTQLWPPWLSVMRPSHACCCLAVFLTVLWQLVLEHYETKEVLLALPQSSDLYWGLQSIIKYSIQK